MADFKLDNDVRDVLSREGGLTQAFIFPSSATEKLSAMLGTGVSIDEKKRDQSFFTPTPLALKVATIAEVTGYDVLEPSAGRGALALACMDSGANGVECFENNREYVDELLSQGFPVTHGDFLRFHPAGRRYERIVMNPPFTKNQDVKHVRHAMLWLKPSGILVAIMFDNQTRTSFVEFAEDFDPEIIEVPHGTFKKSGTDISTLIVKIRK